MTNTTYHIKADIITQICEQLAEKKPINQELPNNSVLHIDKMLPFICVYRFNEPDVYFSRVLKTQASYLIVDERVDISHLLEAIRLIMSKEFDTFLILECIPKTATNNKKFQISCPKGKAPGTIKALKQGFAELKDFYPSITVKVKDTVARHPEHLKPLLNVDESKKKGTLVIGLKIPVLYRNRETNELFSLFFREFYSVFSETIKRAVFEFIRVQTTDSFENFLMLGKTNIDAITMEADTQLAQISEGMSFLLRTTPVNSNEEWINFKKNEFKKMPNFKYRLIALDPEQEKRKLYNIPIDEVDDPTIAFILRGKRLEIEKQLTMLEERGTKNFRFVGESLYGVIKKKVLAQAKHILKTFPKRENKKSLERFNCKQFAAHAQIELDYYNTRFPDMNLSLEIRDDVAGIMVSKSKLLINKEVDLDKDRCDALIQHEVGTHILTYCNGKRQPLKQMYEGFEGYDQLQEGLAVIAEYLVGGLTINRLRLLAGRVIAVESMVNGSNFIETFNLLCDKYSFSNRIAYYISMRVYRGGGLTKDAVYLAGLIDLMEYLKNGGNLENLYTGKFNITHIELINELVYRNVLKKPELPRFLERESVKKRLKKLRKGIDITELVN
ncbi:flavohemoglobin expression-modulating QEGLA motif protein [Psychroserpens sp. Hel_I_66]|uniref:flavohemoglobin expression-modulating QEGLA motif protein n=1 Tax=Psychroserpens sp. Hel_I_66 TaxID=1250004 RepID=UPI00068AB038|nr:tyrosine/phenylalanine carboxypeptidase domain-containing protein [Psychroserpens sp. Hel_I_66]